MADYENVESWITVNGQHIPIGAGESKDDAIKRALERRNNQISKNKAQADKLNSEKGKNTYKSDVVSQVESKKFEKDLKDAKDSRPKEDGWRVDSHDAKELDERGCKCFTSKGGSTVAVDKDGDIISVCKKMGDDTISGKQLLGEAVKMGGVKLDSFDGNHGFYVSQGFMPVSWLKFNKEYAPDGWSKSGCGEENVIFYRYVGKGNVPAKYMDASVFCSPGNGKEFTGENAYDDAKDYRDSQLKK